MNRETEIRKISPASMFGLVQILETSCSWKKLMEVVPKHLDIADSAIKYTSEHVKYVERHSESQRREAAAIFLEEWGISGRNRPKIKHLLMYLKNAQLYRAADYVAQKLLNEPPPERPIDGPAAIVAIDDSLSSSERQQIENHLNDISYNSSLFNGNFREDYLNQNNTQYSNGKSITVPKIIVDSLDDTSQITTDNNTQSSVSSNISYDNMPDLHQLQSNGTTELNGNTSEEVIPKFSSLYNNSPSSEFRPEISQLLNKQFENEKKSEEILNSELISEEGSNFIPQINSLLNNTNNEINTVPQLSFLMQNNTDENKITNSDIQLDLNALDKTSSEQLAPSFSSLLSEERNITVEITTSSSNNESDSNNDVPLISALLSPQKDINLVSTRRVSNASPLPTLNLKTELPHIPFEDLERVTNHFNKDKYIKENGNMSARFLGSGAFGAVYLGVGLFGGGGGDDDDDKVAVKKLHLHGMDEIRLDDTITKQFINEVELLHKYRHENLISLLGYSCDGPTYCLIYQYVCKGALGERLVSDVNILPWICRIIIGQRVASGVAYLHSAYETPLIHRDIKSANILLDYENFPKLCDFGLIKLSPNTNTYTATTVLGTSAYMAPEAFRGDVSIKMDTFSFGVVLLELLTGLPPLDDNREGADLVTHVEDRCEEGSIKPLLDYRAGVWVQYDIDYSQKVFDIALMCLEEKRKRPTMVEVNKMLQKLVEQLDIDETDEHA